MRSSLLEMLLVDITRSLQTKTFLSKAGSACLSRTSSLGIMCWSVGCTKAARNVLFSSTEARRAAAASREQPPPHVFRFFTQHHHEPPPSSYFLLLHVTLEELILPTPLRSTSIGYPLSIVSLKRSPVNHQRDATIKCTFVTL
jgi:hypothetical protein